MKKVEEYNVPPAIANTGSNSIDIDILFFILFLFNFNYLTICSNNKFAFRNQRVCSIFFLIKCVAIDIMMMKIRKKTMFMFYLAHSE